MHHYFISDNVVFETSTDKSLIAESDSKVKQTLAKVKRGFIAVNDRLQNIRVISSLEQLQQFQCATKCQWQHGITYIEHPRHPNLLIPRKEYDSYILREIIADLQNYIIDHFAVSELVIGFVSSSPKNCGVMQRLDQVLKYRLKH